MCACAVWMFQPQLYTKLRISCSNRICNPLAGSSLQILCDNSGFDSVCRLRQLPKKVSQSEVNSRHFWQCCGCIKAAGEAVSQIRSAPDEKQQRVAQLSCSFFFGQLLHHLLENHRWKRIPTGLQDSSQNRWQFRIYIYIFFQDGFKLALWNQSTLPEDTIDGKVWNSSMGLLKSYWAATTGLLPTGSNHWYHCLTCGVLNRLCTTNGGTVNISGFMWTEIKPFPW